MPSFAWIQDLVVLLTEFLPLLRIFEMVHSLDIPATTREYRLHKVPFVLV
jgi:hypothetical protein